jgi:hypothetical protein
MRRRHVAAPLLSLLAALIWAPLSVWAAPLNTLSSPYVSPASGDTNTVFTFSVRYISLAGTIANSVSVTVAGRVVGLTLTSGTSIDGTWTGSSRLAAGTWGTQFSAVPAKGPKPSLAGPTVTVTAAASATVGPSASTAPSSSDLPDGSSAPTAEPSQVSAPNATGHASSSTAPAAAGQGAASSPSASSGSAAGSGTPPGTSSGSGSGTNTQSSPGAGSSRSPISGAHANGVPSSSGSGQASGTQSGSPLEQANEPSGRGSRPDMGLYAALVLAAAVLACLVLLVSWRSLDDDPATAAVTPLDTPVRPGPRGTTPGPDARPQPDVLHRRVTARQRVPADDPILSALGLDPKAPAASGAAALRARRTTRGRSLPISERESGEHAGGEQTPGDRSES